MSNNRHKHADIIHAWAEGTTIQVYSKQYGWLDIGDQPTFINDNQYRIKPEPKPDIVKEYHLFLDVLDGLTVSPFRERNVRLIFDGETTKLKSVEMIDV
jgi:hypothetical protein